MVLAAIGTGLEKLTCCHPVADSAAKTACASTAPEVEYNSPRCVPLLEADPLKKRIPETVPLTSERNFSPSVTGASLNHGRSGETVPLKIPLPAAAGGGAGTAVVLNQRGEEVRLEKGAALTLRLTQPLTIRVRG